MEIFALRDLAYVAESSGRRQLCRRRRVHQVPALVADVAVNARFALRTDTEEGRAAIAREKPRPESGNSFAPSGLSLEDCEDLKDPCGYLEPGEVA